MNLRPSNLGANLSSTTDPAAQGREYLFDRGRGAGGAVIGVVEGGESGGRGGRKGCGVGPGLLHLHDDVEVSHRLLVPTRPEKLPPLLEPQSTPSAVRELFCCPPGDVAILC
ncbi:hypothetical protein BHM03_00011362 [Ensete ventricosum]|nr:hypothetical protein BHM03_00011362 [Ensete ventricosum]